MQRHLVLVSCLCLVAGCTLKHKYSLPEPAPRISPGVVLTRHGVEVKNLDTFAYPSPEVMINLNQTGRKHEALAGTIEPGKSILIPYGEFVDRTERFNVNSTKIFTITVKTKISSAASYRVSVCPNTIGQCQLTD